MRRNAWKDIANLRNKTTQQNYKVSTPCMDDHQFEEEEIGSVGELSTVCSQIVLECLSLARIGRPDINGLQTNLLVRSQKWTKACDKRLARLTSYIHHISETGNVVMWETQHNNADKDCFKTLILLEECVYDRRPHDNSTRQSRPRSRQ